MKLAKNIPDRLDSFLDTFLGRQNSACEMENQHSEAENLNLESNELDFDSIVIRSVDALYGSKRSTDEAGEQLGFAPKEIFQWIEEEMNVPEDFRARASYSLMKAVKRGHLHKNGIRYFLNHS